MKPALVGVSVTATQAVCQLAVVAITAKFLGVEQVGEFTLVNSILLLFTTAFSFGVREAYLIENDSFGFRTFGSLRLLGVGLCFLFSFVAVLAINTSLIVIFFPLAVFRLLTMYFDFQLASYQFEKQYRRILVSQIGRFGLSTVVFGVSVFVVKDFSLQLWFYALSVVFIHMVIDLPVHLRSWKKDTTSLNIKECF